MKEEDKQQLIQIQGLLNKFLLSHEIHPEDIELQTYIQQIDLLKQKNMQLEEELMKEKKKSALLEVELNELKMDQLYGGGGYGEVEEEVVSPFAIEKVDAEDEDECSRSEKGYDDVISEDSEVLLRRGSDGIVPSIGISSSKSLSNSFKVKDTIQKQGSNLGLISQMKKKPASSKDLRLNFYNPIIEVQEEGINEKFSTNFESMMKKKREVELFRIFSEDYGYGNYFEFYESLHRFRDLKIGPEKDDLYATIFCDFIAQKSIVALPLPKKIRYECQALYNNDEPHAFDNVEIEVYEILKQIYQQFKSSNIWRVYVKENYRRSENAHFSDLYEVIELKSKGITDNVPYKIFKVQHKVNGIIYLAKHLSLSVTEAEIAFISYLQKYKHSNLVKLEDIFKEKNDKKMDLFLVTNLLETQLDQFIDTRVKSNAHLKNLELINFMLQLSIVLQYSHSNSYIFDLGEISEPRIFLSSTFSELFLDPGFIVDSKTHQHITPPEYSHGDAPTVEGNIFALGLIFLRLGLNVDISQFESIFGAQMKSSSLSRSQSENSISKKKKLSTIVTTTKKSMIQKEFPYYATLKATLQKYQNSIDPKILQLIKQMLKPVPSDRVNCSKLVNTLKKLQEEFEKKELVQNKVISTNGNNEDQTKDNVLSLSGCLKNPHQRKYFKLFLKKERAEENVIFIEEVEKMKSLTSVEARIKKANEIISTFMDRCSILEINISEQLIRDVMNHVKLGEKYRNLTSDVFEIIVEDIKLNILTDPWKRFLDSDLKEEMNAKAKRRSIVQIFSPK
eukprot:gene9040-1137_t